MQYQGWEVFQEGDSGVGGESDTGEATKLTPSHCQHYPHGRYEDIDKNLHFHRIGGYPSPPILTE